MYVQLNIFSGKPNPIWTLTREQCDFFLHKINELKPSRKAFSQSDELGYRGFIVGEDYNNPNITQRYEIYDGKVKDLLEPTKVYEDIGNTIEGLLLQSGHEYIDQDLYDYVKKEIGWV